MLGGVSHLAQGRKVFDIELAALKAVYADKADEVEVARDCPVIRIECVAQAGAEGERTVAVLVGVGNRIRCSTEGHFLGRFSIDVAVAWPLAD